MYGRHQHLDMGEGGFQAQPVLNMEQLTDEEEAALIKKLDVLRPD